ncbi:hypothetical protein BIV24_11770 [Streptomyces colonosanans]|uniref:DNA primase n=1 Tax=Streptomyces colonosanans TaxID=1428652 RepID=A0A1S2PIU7_9ACTN|nr:hypothetical protein BIV24_11770 [Streptomyces colonosanans]
MGLAIGAGYVLGRAKKMKLALAVGTLVAGKRLQLDPRALARLVDEQLLNNPELKEIGDQLREDLRGVGSAASGALVEKQIEGLADRLHDRTERVREQLSDVVPEPSLRSEGEETEEGRAEETGSDNAARGASEAESAPRRKPAPEAPSGKRHVRARDQQGAGTRTARKAAKAARTATSKKPADAQGGVARTIRGPAGEGRR